MILLLFVLLLCPSVVQALETLEMVSPLPPGAAGVGWDSSNRIYRAYAGIPYKIRADARGGRWPYTYSLTNAPQGMTIETGPCTTIGPTCSAGAITWVNPTANATNVVAHVCDADSVCVQGSWSITVSTTIGADGFCFLDIDNGNDTTGTGQLNNPWKTLAKGVTSCGPRSIMYLRDTTPGTGLNYLTTGFTEVPPFGVEGWQHVVDINEASHPVIWIGYPEADGTMPTIDEQATGTNEVQFFRTVGANIWQEGYIARNIQTHVHRINIRTNRYGVMIWRITGRDLVDGVNNNNSAFYMWDQNFSANSFFDRVSECDFEGMYGDGVGLDSVAALKFYAVYRMITQNTRFADDRLTEATIATKAQVPQFTIRGNICTANVVTCTGGNMNDGGGDGIFTGGEIYHNLMLGGGTGAAEGTVTIGVTRIATIAPIHVYRNTLKGMVDMNAIQTGDGPFTFDNNVIVNPGGSGGSCPQQLTCFSVTNYTPIVVNANNLQGPDNGTIIDANGLLTGTSRTQFLGIDGFEFGTSGNKQRLNGGSRVSGSVTFH